MRGRVTPGGTVGGEAGVPGDKSIAHRWLLMAATADGRSRLEGLPRSLDVCSTAACLSQLAPAARPALEAWASSPSVTDERHGSTWNRDPSTLDLDTLDLAGEGRGALREPDRELDCGNSGTTMRLLAGLGVVGSVRNGASGRPEPVIPTDGAHRASLARDGGRCDHRGRARAARRPRRGAPGILFEPDVPSAQVKGAVLLAALAAEGRTTVAERVRTRDHTERLFLALGAPVHVRDATVDLDGPFQHGGFRGTVPGDPSSAAFLLGAAASRAETSRSTTWG